MFKLKVLTLLLTATLYGCAGVAKSSEVDTISLTELKSSQPVATKLVKKEYQTQTKPKYYLDIKSELATRTMPEIVVAKVYIPDQASDYEVTYGGVTRNDKQGIVSKSKVKTILSSNAEEKFKLENKLKDFTIGGLIYNVPKSMRLGASEKISVIISPLSIVQDVISSIPSNRRVAQQDVKVYTYMAVKVFGSPNFEVSALSNEQQLSSKSEPTQWDFIVVPRVAGSNKLNIRVSARIKLDDGAEEYKDFPVFTKDVYVEVSIWYLITQWISQYWQWLLGFIGSSGVAGWIYKKIKTVNKTYTTK